jgi:preprotein translocase subunit SecG
MLTFLLILIGIACVLLTFIVLIQNPKGGGIAANFSATNQIMGVKRTTDIVERLTWIFAISLIVLVLSTNYIRTDVNAGPEEKGSRINTDELPQAPPPVQQAPGTQPGGAPGGQNPN